MAWCLIVKSDTGELVSEASDHSLCAPPDILAAKGLEVVEHGPDRPDHRLTRWDTSTKRYVPKVQVDRVDDLKMDPEFNAVTMQQWQLIERALDKVLGPRRFRQNDEGLEVR